MIELFWSTKHLNKTLTWIKENIRENAEYEEYRVEFDQDGTEAGADAIDEIF